MSKFDDFKAGQRVAHISMGDGVVERADADHVVVRFDSWKSVGKYDRRWFEIYPTYLFGRSEPSAEPNKRAGG